MCIDEFSSGKGYSWKLQMVPPYFSWPMSSGYNDSNPTWCPWVREDVLMGGSSHSSSHVLVMSRAQTPVESQPPPRLNKAGRVVGGGPRWHSTSCVSSLIPWHQKSTPIQRKCDTWAWCFAYTRQLSAKAGGVRGPPSSAVRQCAWLLMLGYL